MNPEKVYSLSDLPNWPRAPLTSLAVLGHPVAHSLSPKMQNAALDFLGRNDIRYFKFDIAPNELPAALKLFFEKGFLGLNLTIPHKILALPELEHLSVPAKMIGAANTLFRSPTGTRFSGTNTDGNGFVQAAKSAFPSIFLPEKSQNCVAVGAPNPCDEKIVPAKIVPAFPRTVLLGAGGASRGIAFAVAQAGCEHLTIFNRTSTKALALANELKISFPQLKICVPANESELASALAGTLVVNATSLGLHADDASPIAFPLLEKSVPAAIYDITYGAHDSALISWAKKNRVPVADGRSMLAWQGALALEIWLSVPAAKTVPVMLEALK